MFDEYLKIKNKNKNKKIDCQRTGEKRWSNMHKKVSKESLGLFDSTLQNMEREKRKGKKKRKNETRTASVLK